MCGPRRTTTGIPNVPTTTGIPNVPTTTGIPNVPPTLQYNHIVGSGAYANVYATVENASPESTTRTCVKVVVQDPARRSAFLFWGFAV